MPYKCFDVAVLGLGTMGTFVCLELARRKASVIGLDQFTPPHDRGSHTGDTRVFRVAYAEHPDYVPLAKRAGILWNQHGQEAGMLFLHRSGMLSIGPDHSALISGIRASASAHGLSIEALPIEEIRERFPAFTPPDGSVGIFEPSAGWVDVGASLRYGIECAQQRGAEVRLDARVENWTEERGHFLVKTSTEAFRAQRLVFTAGAWTGQFLARLNLPLTILRKVLVWVDPLHPAYFKPGTFPVFAFGDRFFYGFPNLENRGVKLAIHWSKGAPLADPDVHRSEPNPDEIEPVLQMASELMPSLAGPLPDAFRRVVKTKTCLYTMTPDEHFIIDRHPDFENVYFATGFSGHGFKFAPAIGEALAELALEGKASLPMGFLSLKRAFVPEKVAPNE